MNTEDNTVDVLKAAANANRDEFVREFTQYGHLVQSMSPAELAQEIGLRFPNPQQAAILCTLAYKLMRLENGEA